MAAEEAANPVKSDDSFSMRMMTKTFKMKWPSVQNLTTEQLQSWIISPEKDVVLLDPRPTEEFDVSHLVNAIRVNPDAENADVQQTVERLRNTATDTKSQVVVCYCSVGYRSSRYALALQSQLTKDNTDQTMTPIPEVFNLEGSLFKWANENRPMVDIHGNPTIFAHPYSAVWGKLLRAELRKSTL